MVDKNIASGQGMVLGKFYVPTRGHQYLLEFARNYVKDLTVLMCSLQREQIPAELRFQWMQRLFPGVRIEHVTDENPQYPHEHPDFWQIWHDTIRKYIPSGPDYVFASEDYGFKLAEILGSKYVPVDQPRSIMPVSSTAVRENPMANWEFIPFCVRPYFVRRVCVIGPESTGKTILAARLAEHYRTVLVPEYARGCIDAHQGKVSPELFEIFLRGQAASEAALAEQANRLLICDSDAFTTALYYELFYGACPKHFYEEAGRRGYHLYLLTECDTPFVADPQRWHPEKREWFFDRCLDWIKKRGASYAVIKGSWEQRFEVACRVVDELLADSKVQVPI